MEPKPTKPDGSAAPQPPEDLWQALWQIATRPFKTLVPPWSWKAAAVSAFSRGAMFFATNLRSGPHAAFRAMAIEAVFAVFAAGIIGAISQQLRAAKPVWATATLVWLGLPGAMVLLQVGLHRAAHTPHLGSGVLVSFFFAALASAFSWYAMRHGALLGGTDSTSILEDMRHLPGIASDFILAAPRMVWHGLGNR